MKVTQKRREQRLPMGSTKPGQTIIHNDRPHLVLVVDRLPAKADEDLAADLESGAVVRIQRDTVVGLVEAELVVDR